MISPYPMKISCACAKKILWSCPHWFVHFLIVYCWIGT